MAATSADNGGLPQWLHRAVEPEATASLLQLFEETLERTLRKILSEITVSATPSPALPTDGPSSPASVSPGTDLKHQDIIRGTDLRTSLLLGKIPGESGLLIDRKTFAELLSVSSRHLARLEDLKAVPRPVHLGRPH